MDFLLPLQNAAENFLNAKFPLSDTYSNGQVIGAISVMLVALVITRILQYFINVKLKEFAKATETTHDDELVESLDGPVAIFTVLWAGYIAVAILDPPYYREFIDKIIITLVTIDVTWFLFRLTDVTTRFLAAKYEKEDKKVVMTMFPLINKAAKVFVVIVSFIMIIQNLGYSVSSLLAGLGIGGLAVALAAKDTLANVFGSVMIFLDRPFVIGDWIKVKDIEGIVEDVGFRTTRIRTFGKYEVSIPNTVVVNETIQNFSRRPMRRISTTIGITYDTPPEKIRKAIKKIKEIILNHPKTYKKTCFVHFSEFGESHLGIFMYFFINTADWGVFMQAREEIFLQIMEEFNKMGIEFAFPSRTIYIAKSNNKATQTTQEIEEPVGV